VKEKKGKGGRNLSDSSRPRREGRGQKVLEGGLGGKGEELQEKGNRRKS